MSEYYLTDKGEKYMYSSLKSSKEDKKIDYIVLLIVKNEPESIEEIVNKSDLFKSTFRGLFEAGYIEEVR